MTSEPDAPGVVERFGYVFAAALVALTVLAIVQAPEQRRTAAGERVDPSSAYNPVTAGEALPDGFRQLLPRDAIRPVYEPQFVPADGIYWPPSTDVIGVAIAGEAKAYPVSFLSGRELVIDQVGDVPILVSW